MLWGILIALFGTPSAGVSSLVAHLACLPFILAGMAATMHSFGRPSGIAVAIFLIVTALLLVVTSIGFAPGERACEASMLSLELSETVAFRCKAVVAVLFGIMWLALGVAVSMHVAKTRKG